MLDDFRFVRGGVVHASRCASDFIEDVDISHPTLLEIDADFPAMASDDEPAGKRFAQFLVASLNSADFQATEPEQHSTYGWCFYVTHNKVTTWCMLQLSSKWVLTVESPLFLVHWMLCRKPRTQLKAIHQEVERILRNDARVESVRWYTRKQFESRYTQGGDASTTSRGR